MDESLEYFRRALAIYQGLANADPDNVSAVRTLAYGFENIAQAWVVAGDADEARITYEQAIRLRRRLVETDPRSDRLKQELESTQASYAAFSSSLN